jgi:hypothetical protein
MALSVITPLSSERVVSISIEEHFTVRQQLNHGRQCLFQFPTEPTTFFGLEVATEGVSPLNPQHLGRPSSRGRCEMR